MGRTTAADVDVRSLDVEGTMVRQTLITGLRRHGEKLALLVYLGLAIGIAPVLTGLFETAWLESQLLRSLMGLRQLAGIGQEVINLAFLGFVGGLLLLMMLDSKKRWEALLVWLGFGLTLFELASAELFVPALATAEDAVWLVPGLALGLLWGGGSKALRLKRTGPNEYRRATWTTWSVYAVLFVLLSVSLIEAHVTYPEVVEITDQGLAILTVEDPSISLQDDGLLLNAVAAGIAVGVTRRFTRYESADSFFVLGPPASERASC